MRLSSSQVAVLETEFNKSQVKAVRAAFSAAERLVLLQGISMAYCRTQWGAVLLQL